MNGDLLKFAELRRINNTIPDPEMSQRNLNFFILFLFVFTLTSTTQAQGRLYVHQKDGKQKSYALSGIRKLTFPAETMVIAFRSVPSVNLSLAGIQYCNFRYISPFPGIVVNVYPNPVVDKLNIDCSEAMGELILYDAIGRKIIQVFPEANSFILKLGHLSGGIYILHILTTRSNIVKEIIKD